MTKPIRKPFLIVVSLVTLLFGAFFFMSISNNKLVGSKRLTLLGSTIAVQNHEQLYFANPGDGFNLYMSKPDMSERTKLINKRVFDLAVSDRWLVYSSFDDQGSLYKLDLESLKTTKLNNRLSSGSTIVGDLVFYISDNWLFQINIDGSAEKKLTEKRVNTFKYDNGWIYFISRDGGDSIQKVRPDGTGLKVVAQIGVSRLAVNGGNIFFIGDKEDNYKLYKMKNDGSSLTLISNDSAQDILVDEGYIYYYSPENGGQLVCVGSDGKEKTILMQGSPSYNLSLGNYWIYYMNHPQGNELFRIHTKSF